MYDGKFVSNLSLLAEIVWLPKAIREAITLSRREWVKMGAHVRASDKRITFLRVTRYSHISINLEVVAGATCDQPASAIGRLFPVHPFLIYPTKQAVRLFLRPSIVPDSSTDVFSSTPG
jgi:hypothetical protein